MQYLDFFFLIASACKCGFTKEFTYLATLFQLSVHLLSRHIDVNRTMWGHVVTDADFFDHLVMFYT